MRGSKRGERRGGRTKGTPNKKTAERIEAIEASGLVPLDFMLPVLRDEAESMENRMWAAEKAVPYVHAKLASVEVIGAPDKPLQTITRIELVAPGYEE